MNTKAHIEIKCFSWNVYDQLSLKDAHRVYVASFIWFLWSIKQIFINYFTILSTRYLHLLAIWFLFSFQKRSILAISESESRKTSMRDRKDKHENCVLWRFIYFKRKILNSQRNHRCCALMNIHHIVICAEMNSKKIK